ncbi:unnamed protein product [Peronospora belbahrii]|uniref:TRP C-terminal domain-containing protein n=1 Tax=Peronospora belbahrii TaxID=622444 RepID=A0AAU9L9Y1_9STRA|nr:unnamed protein product [Peronospora belbahrii]
MNRRLLALLGVVALTHRTLAATTCPVLVQSKTTSTLKDPIVKVITLIPNGSTSSTSSISSGSSNHDLTSSYTGSGSDSDLLNVDGNKTDQNVDVDSSSSGTPTSVTVGDISTDTTLTGSDNSAVDSLPTTTTTDTTPSSASNTAATTEATAKATSEATTEETNKATTEATTKATLPVVTTPTASTESASDTTTIKADSSPSATATTAAISASSGSSNTAADTTASLSVGARKLQVRSTTPTTAIDPATKTTATAETAGTIATTGTNTTTGTNSTTSMTTESTLPSPTTESSLMSPTTAGSSSGTDVVGSTTSSSDSLSCDSSFYSKWDTLGLQCGGLGINVALAVSASSCVIYSGNAGGVSGSTCVSICSFPACTDNAWVYGAENGISSSVYNGLSVEAFLPSDVIAAMEERSSTVSTFLSNSTMSDSEQCAYSSENSFSSCSCSALLVDISSSGSLADAAKKELRQNNEAVGVITKDDTTSAGTVVAATSKSVAGVTVAVTSIAAIASAAVGGVSSAGASLAAAGSTMAITTVEICQFGVLINQLQLDGKSSALAQFGKAMAPATFTFLPFGKLDKAELDSISLGSDSSTEDTAGRRLSSSSGSKSSTSTSQLTGIEKYSRQLNIQEDMLFIVTLAGVFCVMACVVGLFGIGYLLAGLLMPREEYLTKFFDKMIGLEVLVAILSQYTVGVTATFQIYYSTKYESITDPKCLLAIAAIVFLAAGILVYGYVVVKKHEADIADVGTVQHMKKTVNMRYGPLYEEYKFKNRYFFAAKMMLALATGVITGCASMSGKAQIGIILALNVVFFFYLEIQSPHHSKFVQTTTSFVSIMKIAVLVLTFFLVTAATSDGFPTSLQNGISVAIVGLNLFVLALLMIRSLYTFWQKLKLQRNAAYDQEEPTAQDYFKDETPAGQKDRTISNAQHPSGLPVFQSQYPNVNNDNNNPYVQGNAVDYNTADEIRLRSATHENNARQQTYDASGPCGCQSLHYGRSKHVRPAS